MAVTLVFQPSCTGRGWRTSSPSGASPTSSRGFRTSSNRFKSRYQNFCWTEENLTFIHISGIYEVTQIVSKSLPDQLSRNLSQAVALPFHLPTFLFVANKECVPVSIIFIVQGVPYSRPFMYVSYISWNLSIIIACIVKDIVEDKEKTKFLSTHFTAFVR